MVGFNMQGSTRILFYGGLAVLQTQSIFQATPANWVCMLLNRSQFLKRKPDRPTDSENENTLWQNVDPHPMKSWKLLALGLACLAAWRSYRQCEKVGIATKNVTLTGTSDKHRP
jgi:hypothetical protein